jgi:hypothetical protein
VERRAVRKVDERDTRLGVASGAHPAPNSHRCILRRLAGEDAAHVESGVGHRRKVTRRPRHCPDARKGSGDAGPLLPTDLPVVRSPKFDFVINLRTARAPASPFFHAARACRRGDRIKRCLLHRMSLLVAQGSRNLAAQQGGTAAVRPIHSGKLPHGEGGGDTQPL